MYLHSSKYQKQQHERRNQNQKQSTSQQNRPKQNLTLEIFSIIFVISLQTTTKPNKKYNNFQR